MPESGSIDLTRHFLIAMPGLVDGLFTRSVIYICEHGEDGAMGLIVNKTSDLSLTDLFEKIELPLRRPDLTGQPVYQGGPVRPDRGFVLHSPMRPSPGKATAVPTDGIGESAYASTLHIPDGLDMTTSRDVLEALSLGAGPSQVLVTLGYSAWGQGQLESEIAENAWITVAADASVVFDTPVAERYDRALSLLGLSAWMLAPEAGRA
ncbi:MAG TPA: YqgE/AlgH family protein [Burkholderiaceae bacterium]|jgi:putative transcriptional regulator|nr:YqgE/AlgH family protein [Burkholderiaceae bacterium]